jgi:type IV secretory pathway VirJ component
MTQPATQASSIGLGTGLIITVIFLVLIGLVFLLGDPYAYHATKIDDSDVATRLAPIGHVVIASKTQAAPTETAAPATSERQSVNNTETASEPTPAAPITSVTPTPSVTVSAPQRQMANNSSSQHALPFAPDPNQAATTTGAKPSAVKNTSSTMPVVQAKPQDDSKESAPTITTESTTQDTAPSVPTQSHAVKPIPRWMPHNAPLPAR